MKTNDTVKVDWLRITPIHKRHTDTTKTYLSNNELKTWRVCFDVKHSLIIKCLDLF